MIAGFVIWSAVSLLLLGIGIWSWRSEKAVMSNCMNGMSR